MEGLTQERHELVVRQSLDNDFRGGEGMPEYGVEQQLNDVDAENAQDNQTPTRVLPWNGAISCGEARERNDGEIEADKIKVITDARYEPIA